MNLKQIQKKYGTQEKCLSFLRKMRYGKRLKCPYCDSKRVIEAKNDAGRYHCYNCNRSFSMLIGTIFEDTKLPLPDWFLIAGLMLNAKTGISASEISRDLGIPLKTAWLTSMKIRCAMIDKKTLLHGVLEADESYFTSSHYIPNSTPINKPVLSKVVQKRGRGTKKTPVFGVLEKGGKVKTKIIEKLTAKNLMSMLRHYVELGDSVLITDSFSSYNRMEEIIEHIKVKHKEKVKGTANINQIEGFWGYVKNGIRGSFKSISKQYLPFYLTEFEYKYNRRNQKIGVLEAFIKDCVTSENSMVNYKPIKSPKKIAA